MTVRTKALRVFLAALMLIGAVAGYLAFQGPGVIIDLAKTILRENGFPEIEFSVSDFSIETVTLEGIRIGQGGNLKIPRISAVFTWRELIDGQVGEISIDGLELTAHRLEQGLSFGELDAFVYGDTDQTASEETSSTAFHWPFRKLSLSNARITLLEDSGMLLSMAVDGAVQRNPSGGLNIGPAQISAVSPSVSLTATVSAALSEAGNVSASLALEHGKADLQGYEVTVQEGFLDLETPLADLAALKASARLRVSKIALPLGFATTGDLNLSVKDGHLQASVSGEDADRGLAGTFSVETMLGPTLADQPVTAALTLTASDIGLLPEPVLPVAVRRGAVHLGLTMKDKVGNLQTLADVRGLLDLAHHFPGIGIQLAGLGIESDLLPGIANFETALRLEKGGQNSIALFTDEAMELSLSPNTAEEWTAILGPMKQIEEIAPLTVRFLPRNESPILEFHPGEILQKGRLDTLLRFEGGALPSIDASIDASLIADPEAGIFDATLNRGKLTIGHAVINDISVTDLLLDLNAAATEKSASGAAELSATFSGGNAEVLQVPSGDLSFPITWQYSPEKLTVELPDCAGFSVPRVLAGTVAADMRNMRFCLSQGSDPFLAVQFDQTGTPAAGELNAKLTARSGDIVVTMEDDWRARMAGKGFSVGLEAGYDGTGTTSVASDIRFGAVTLASTLLRFDGLHLTATSDDIDKLLIGRLKGRATDLQKPRRIAPVDLAAQTELQNQDKVVASGSAAAAQGPFIFEWEAEHKFSTGEGRASARIPPFEFGFGVNTLSDITDLLDGIVARPAGQLLAALSAQWSGQSACGNGDLLVRRASASLPGTGPVPVPGEVTLGQLGVTGKLCLKDGEIGGQAGQLLLENLEFAGDQISAKAVNANLDIESFLPFSTKPEQILSVGVVDLGFPLTDGFAKFSVAEGATVSLDDLGFNWIGGKVAIEPLLISPDAPLEAIVLAVKGAQLEKLTELVPDKGVTGEGILDGSIPIRLLEDGPAVENGFLEARGPGILRYKRTLTEGEEASAVDDVLSNLQYSKLRMDIDGGLSGGVQIGLHVEGTNPDYLDGYPVVLDVNVNGPLGAIMNDGLATYKVPSQIMERMRRFGQLE